MEKVYSSYEEIKDSKLRHTIEGLAQLYHNGDVNAALVEFNTIDETLGTVFIENNTDDSMETQLRFAINQ